MWEILVSREINRNNFYKHLRCETDQGKMYVRVNFYLGNNCLGFYFVVYPIIDSCEAVTTSNFWGQLETWSGGGDPSVPPHRMKP